jgi:hypothetical protein
MSSSSSGANDKDKEDLDIFLTTIESKLRGPFSSLDLAKSVTTSALRGSLTPPQYLQNLNLVLLRTDKVSQLRILIGLLGLDPEPQIDEQLVNILETAQQKSDEPWVRTIAGLIQGILFKDEEDSSRKSCRGEVAEELLSKTCEDICQNILKIHQMSKKEDGCQPDLNAYFVPYRYSLISANLLQQTKIHEFGNPHFQVNQDAAILKIDEELEAQRAKEAQVHAPLQFRQQGNASASSTNDSSTATGSNLPPGYKPTNLVEKAKRSTSMFVTRPNPAAKKAQLSNRAKLMRRKGGAQSLLSGTDYKSHTTSGAVADKTADAGPPKSMEASRTEPTTRAAAVPRGRFSSGKSKMKMLDVDTVSSLHQQTMQRKQEEALSKISKKRRIMEAAKQQGLKKTKLEQTPPEQQQQQQPESSSPKKPQAAPATDAPPAPQAQAPATQQQQSEQEWRVLLRERSNKLSDDDRSRVQEFFENQFDPTSEQPIYKMKLHEQRTMDSTTGKNIKETFYLELDYQNNTSKQSKKIKRY